ncbi:MAG TPA: OmpA family protein [Candidatus Acidoferrales bacterium]|nr:OmpA family protein [Candidatus Acidoferrales bacterium]
MRKAYFSLPVLLLCGASFVSAQAAPQQQSQSQQEKSAPLYSITLEGRTTKAVNYLHTNGPTPIGFEGTPLLPYGKGEAKVESKRGAVKIAAKFSGLVAATKFGPQYLTYVLWAISPEGRATNLGEILAQNGKGKLDVTAQLQAFALIVTAEPYFAVMQPSELVVMENVVRPDTAGNVEEIDAKFDLLRRDQYSVLSTDYQAPKLQPGVPLSMNEARNAVQIAKAMGADHYASDSFQKASRLLQDAEGYLTHRSDMKQLEMTAREAVQTAEDSRAIAVKRHNEEVIAQEQAAEQAREAQAKQQAADAERAKLEAELAAERAAREKADAEAAELKAQADAQKLAEEKAQAEAASAAALKQQQDAEAAKAAALQQQQAAQAEAARAQAAAQQSADEAAKAQAAAQESERQRQQAEADKADLRARLLKQLNNVLQTRDSVRGLIVNMSDVLFDTGSYTLRGGAREKLAKVSGILLAYPGLKLQVEGYTDSVGSDDFNQRLSEQRAGAVRDYLVVQGVSPDAVTATGFGKTRPVASNDTAEGRQQNRRVEIVVNGDAIGTSASASPATSQQ